MNRAARRRASRAAANTNWTLQELQAWEQNRKLPRDHPNKAAEPIISSKELGLRMIGVVDRTAVVPYLDAEMQGTRGPKRRLTVKALQVCNLITAYMQSKSYRRVDVVAVLYGLHPVVAQQLGLVDKKRRMKYISYNSLTDLAGKIEKSLHEGWMHGILRCDMEWFAHRMLRASVPRTIRRKARAAIIDSSPVKCWARTLHYNKQADLAKDAYALHRKLVLDNPHLEEPEARREALARAALKAGLKVGPDGRIIRGTDIDARVGYASATLQQKAHFFVGYELTIVVAAPYIEWQGQPTNFQRGPYIPNYILAMDLTPAGTNPGPIGTRAVLKARRLAPKITEVIADRAYTVKGKNFVQPLHKRGLNVVGDYPKNKITNPHSHSLGIRHRPVTMHCGTFLHTSTPDNQVVPPAWRRRKGNEKALEDWYNKRFEIYAYRSSGPTTTTKKRGGRNFKSPVAANHLNLPTSRPTSYKAPLLDGPNVPSHNGKVSALLENLDQWQEHPYGTTVWKKSYDRRPAVEPVFGRIKSGKGLGGEACKALGHAPNMMAAIAAVVVYNLKLNIVHGYNHTHFKSPPRHCGNSTGNSTGHQGADTELSTRAPP